MPGELGTADRVLDGGRPGRIGTGSNACRGPGLSRFHLARVSSRVDQLGYRRNLACERAVSGSPAGLSRDRLGRPLAGNTSFDAALGRVRVVVEALHSKVADLEADVARGVATAADLAALDELRCHIDAFDLTKPAIRPEGPAEVSPPTPKFDRRASGPQITRRSTTTE